MARRATVEIFRDPAGEWRWRLITPNGNNMAGPQEGYKNKSMAMGAPKKVEHYLRTAKIVVIEP